MSINLAMCLFIIFFVIYESTHDDSWPGGRT